MISATNQSIFINSSKTRHLFYHETLIAIVCFLPPLFAILNNFLEYYNLAIPASLPYFVIYCSSLVLWFLALSRKAFFTSIILVSFLLIISYTSIVFPENKAIIFNVGNGSLYEIAQSNFVTMFFLCLVLLAQTKCDINISVLFKRIKPFIYLISLLFILIVLNATFISKTSINNYMSLSYAALPSTMIIMVGDRMPFKKILLFILFICYLLTGCRGAILCFIILTILKFLSKNKKNTYVLAFFFFLIFTILLLWLFVGSNQVIAGIGNLLDKLGFSGRFVEKLLGTSYDGGLLVFSGRKEILNLIISRLDFFGLGIFGDQIIADTYSHNIIIEILCDFGLFLGMAIVIIFIIFILKSLILFKKTKNNTGLSLLMCFITLIIGKMMFSSTYLTDTSFWMFFSFVALVANKQIVLGADKHENLRNGEKSYLV